MLPEAQDEMLETLVAQYAEYIIAEALPTSNTILLTLLT